MTSTLSHRFHDASHNVSEALEAPGQLRTAGIWGAWATAAMSIPMLIGQIVGVSPMPAPVPVAAVKLALGIGGLMLPMAALLFLGLGAHLAYGAVWGAIGWSVLRIDGPVEGIAFGVGLWALMGLAVLPILGWGPFGLAVAAPIAVVTLGLHLVYGACLGVAYDRRLPRTSAPGQSSSR